METATQTEAALTQVSVQNWPLLFFRKRVCGEGDEASRSHHFNTFGHYATLKVCIPATSCATA